MGQDLAMIKLIVPIVVLLASSPALAQRVGYVDINKVLTTSKAGQRAGAEIRDWQNTKLKEIDDAKKAKAKPERLAELQQQYENELKVRNDSEVSRLRARARAAAEKLPEWKKLDEVREGVPFMTRADLTDKVIKAMDAEPAVDLEKENAALKAELERAKKAGRPGP